MTLVTACCACHNKSKQDLCIRPGTGVIKYPEIPHCNKMEVLYSQHCLVRISPHSALQCDE